MQDSFLPQEEEAVEEQSFLPAPDTAPIARVPRNISEVAAQVALAIDDDERPFPERMGGHASSMQAGGTDALLADVLSRELDDQVVAARAQAIAFSRNQDADKTLFASRMAADAERARAELSLEKAPVQAQEAVAARALESVGLEYAQRVYKDMSSYAQSIDTAAGDVAARNVLALEAAKADEQSSVWDKIKHFGRSVITLELDDNIGIARAISKVVGKDFYLDKYAAITEFRNMMLGMPTQQERDEVMKRLIAELSTNSSVRADALRQIAELTKEDANLDFAMSVLMVADIASLFTGMARIARKGLPVKAVRDVAGEEEAGKLVATDLTTKAGITGLNDSELVSRAIAGGINPMEADPAALRGLNAAAQTQLKEGWDAMLASIRERLNSGAMKPEEVAEAAAKIRNSYMPKTNKQVFTVEFGEASADGQQLTVFWQGANGRPFGSKEAAEEWGKDSLAPGSWSVVPKNVLDEPSPQIGFHGGRDFVGEFDHRFIGSGQGGSALGHGFYSSTKEALGETFARKYGGKDATLFTVDIPENSRFLHWYEGMAAQPKAVQKGLAKVLDTDTLVRARNEGWSGQDIYTHLKDKLGSDAAASKALDDAGVVGNYASRSGAHGVGPEHVVFNAKNVKVVEKKAVEGGVNATRTLDDIIEEENARGLEEMGFFDKAPSGKARDAFDDPSRPLFSSQRILEFSGRIDNQTRKLTRSWIKMLGMEDARILVTTSDDIPQIANKLWVGDDNLNKLLAGGTRANGFHVTLREQDGSLIHIINLNTQRLSTERLRIRTLAHELGHAFDKHVLAGAKPEIRAALAKSFQRWMEQHGAVDADAGELVMRFFSPTKGTAQVAESLRGRSVGSLFDTNPNFATWLYSFDEWWAENFAKFMLTDAVPANAVEKFFKDIADKLHQFYEGLAKIVGFDASKPHAAVEQFLKDHLDTIKGRSANTIAADKAPAAKPRRAPKTPPSPKEEWLVRQTRNDPLSYNSLGKFDDQDIQSMPWVAVDPKHGASELGIEARVVGVHAEAKTRKELEDFIRPYYKGLGKDGTARVRSLLEEGDSFSNGGSYGKEFTYTEALSKGLTEREAEAYLATRQLRMALYHIRNGEMVRHLRAQGMKEIELVGTGSKVAGRVFDSGEASAHADKWLYDATRKEMVKLDSGQMASAYGSGKRLVHLAKPEKIDGELRSLMLVDEKVAKSRDIVTALHYRPGEYSRIYSDEYFITMKRTAKVDGQPTPLTETIRTAASQREAQEFTQRLTKAIAALRYTGPLKVNVDRTLERLIGDYFDVDNFKRAFKDGEFDGVESFDFHYSRNKDEYLNGSVNEALANGRLFTSKRSERLLSTDASRQNTLGVFESLEAEITSVSRVANIGHWRESMVRRWMNSFGHLLPNRTGNDVADFYAAAGATFTKGNKESVFAERTHKYIMRQIGLRTGEERMYEQMTRRMTEHFFSGNEKIESVGAKIRQASVLGFIRNINFNLTLGMFNPAQLIVQANGAATAMILSPLYGLAAAKTFPLLRLALMSDNPKVHKFLGTIDAATVGSVEDFEKLVKAVRQTGIIDNLRSTALWNNEDGKLNIFGGMPSRVWGHNTFFFNRGEEFARLVSFDVARREWMAAHAGADWTTKEALAAMVVRMDDLTQNMTKANLARFQEGAASIPLQFAQYNIKLATNIMTSLLGKGEGRGFTKKEAVALLAGHVALYGAAGNGLMMLVDEVLPQEAKEGMSVEQKTYLAQGLLSGIVSQVGEALTGERTNVALGSRLGVFNYYQQLAEAAYKDPKNIYEVLGGSALSTARRIGTVGEVLALWHRDPELSAEDVLRGLARMTTEMASSTRNVTKAYLYHQHANKMLDAKGVATAQLTGPEVVAQALGFQPGAAVDVHNLIRSKRDHTEAIKGVAELVYKVQKDIMSARMRGDHAYADEQHKLLQALWPENAGDMLEVQRMVRDRLYPYDTDFQRLLGEYMWKGQTYDKPLVVTEQPKKEQQ